MIRIIWSEFDVKIIIISSNSVNIIWVLRIKIIFRFVFDKKESSCEKNNDSCKKNNKNFLSVLFEHIWWLIESYNN